MINWRLWLRFSGTRHPPTTRERVNSKSSFEDKVVVTKAIFEMVDAGGMSVPPIGTIPTIVSPIGVVSKPHSDKLPLIVNMRYVHEPLVDEYSSSKVFQT